VVSILKSKDAFVPCRNFILGKRLSFTAMEKAAACPLRAAFMPNSPMPMLEVSDWLLLTTVSTIAGGNMASSFLFSGVSLLAAGLLLFAYLLLCSLPRFIIIFLALLMVVGVE
jgi:hypothetical protein